MDNLLPIKLPPGMRNTGTPYQAAGRWYTGNFVRFFQDTIQPIGGWVARSLNASAAKTAMEVGVPRAMISYLRYISGLSTYVTVVGTTNGLYAIVGSNVFDITPSSPVFSNVTTRTWALDMFGSYLVATDQSTAATAGRAYYWPGDTAVVATALNPFNNGTGPQNTYGVIGTTDRFLVALGGPRSNSGALLVTGTPNPRSIMWATQEGGFANADWDATATNTAGDLELATSGTVVGARRTRGGTLIWTTLDLWLLTYIGGEFVHRLDQVGNACGLISHEAVAVNDTAAYWMGDNGFWAYDGFVKPIPCDVQDYVFGSLNRSYVHLIWALENPAFGEITWFYPHAAQTEITRYVTYNHRENHWVTGALARTCGISSQPGTSALPVMMDADSAVFDHETGSARNSEGTVSLESGPIELGDGDHLMQVQSVVPDDKTTADTVGSAKTPAVTLTMYGAQNPDAAETTYGPFTLTAKTTLRAKMRQVRLKLLEVSAAAWRVGVIRLGVIKSSRR